MPHDTTAWTLDAAAVQVLFANLQPSMVARSKTNPPAALAASVGVLAEVAGLLGLPMHFSVVPEDGDTPVLIPELAQRARGVALLPRLSASPFLDAATRTALTAAGRKTLIVSCFATDVASGVKRCLLIRARLIESGRGGSDNTEPAPVCDQQLQGAQS